MNELRDVITEVWTINGTRKKYVVGEEGVQHIYEVPSGLRIICRDRFDGYTWAQISSYHGVIK